MSDGKLVWKRGVGGHSGSRQQCPVIVGTTLGRAQQAKSPAGFPVYVCEGTQAQSTTFLGLISFFTPISVARVPGTLGTGMSWWQKMRRQVRVRVTYRQGSALVPYLGAMNEHPRYKALLEELLEMAFERPNKATAGCTLTTKYLKEEHSNWKIDFKL